jgi:hypothetical protein
MPRILRALDNPSNSWQPSGFLATLFYPGWAGPGWAPLKPGPAGLGFLKIRTRPGPDRNPDRNPGVKPEPLRSLFLVTSISFFSKDKVSFYCIEAYTRGSFPDYIFKSSVMGLRARPIKGFSFL